MTDDLKIDAIIILAKGVLADDTIPVLVQHEIDYALSYVQAHPAVTVIYTGTPSETTAMQRYAQPELLLLEDQSRDTIGSAVYCKLLIDKHRWKNLLVLASADHVNRVQTIFAQLLRVGYYIQYHSLQHVLNLRQYIKNTHYERLALAYAKWWFWTLRDYSNTGLLAHLQQHHFMYRPTLLKKLLGR